MAATTITRSTLTDDSGTPASPVGDGDVWNNAELQLIYDNVDSILANAVVFGETVSAEGLGDHVFSGSGSGGNIVHVRNSTSGGTNKAAVHFGIDGPDNDLGMIEGYTSGFTSSGAQQASGLAVRSTGSGGLSLAAEDASGEIRLYGGGTTQIAAVNGSYIYGSGAVPLYATTLADVENTVAETTILTATIGEALNDGDQLDVTIIFDYRNDKGTDGTISFDFLYGGVEDGGANSMLIPDGGTSVGTVALTWTFIRNGTDVEVAPWMAPSVGSINHVPSSNRYGVTLVSPTTTAGQTLSIKATLDAAHSTYYFRPQAGTVRHFFA